MNNNPGPGSYHYLKHRSNPALQYSIRNKTNNTGFLDNLLKTPGPGAYECIPSISQNGRFFNSRYHTDRVPVILPEKNFSNPNHINNPGPGSYRPKNTLFSSVLNTFKKSKGGQFNKESKLTERNLNKYPGPGSYPMKVSFQVKSERKKKT